MKKTSRIICLLLAAVTMVSLAACTQARGVLTYESNTLSAGQYAFALAQRKGSVADYYSSTYGTDISADPEFWNKTSGDSTIADAVEKGALDFCKMMLVAEKLCKDKNISITDETTIANIDAMMEKITTDYGGEDMLNIELAKYGINKDELRQYYENIERIKLLQENLYGENGSMKIPESEVKDSFNKNYLKLSLMFYNGYKTDANNQNVAYYYDQITDADARIYFDSKYVKVQHILYMTVDASGNALSEEEIALAKKNAEESFNSITAGTTTFEQESADNQDSGTEYVFTYGKMASEFETASFEMAVGDIRLVQTKYGYHIIKKLAKEDKDFTAKLDEVKNAISFERTKANAQAMFDKVKNGTAEFVKGGDDADYTFFADKIMKTSDIGSTELETALTNLAVGDYYLFDLGSNYGYYIIQKNELADSDVTNYYDTVESGLINDAFDKYIQTYYNSVQVNQEEIDKYDIITMTSFPNYSYDESSAS